MQTTQAAVPAAQAKADEEYRAKFAKARRLSFQLLKDNEIKAKSKMGLKLAYAVYHGVFDGDVPAGITLLFMAARWEMLITEDGNA